MSTLQNAIEIVEKRRLPYWKLNKGGKRVSECGAEENPDGLPDEALRQFIDEMKTRNGGLYTLVLYRKPNGSSGGFQYEFTHTESNITNYGRNDMPVDMNQVYNNAKREVEMQMAMKRIEDKLDAIGEHILKTTDASSGDGDSLKVLSTLFQFVSKSKAAAISAGNTATTAVNGFKDLM